MQTFPQAILFNCAGLMDEVADWLNSGESYDAELLAAQLKKMARKARKVGKEICKEKASGRSKSRI